MDLRSRLHSILATLARQGFDACPLVFEPPASEAELVEVEQQLRIELPSSFREVLARVSAHVEFQWSAPNDTRFPKPFHENFSGGMLWSLPFLVHCERSRQARIEAAFENQSDPHDRVWHNKLAFQEVNNGDYLAIDLEPASRGNVVYLSHDYGDSHGHILAPSFAELLERWTPLGCTGPEDWQWMPFTDGLRGPLNPTSENSRQWRELLQLDA